jgi:hypothetical protein
MMIGGIFKKNTIMTPSAAFGVGSPASTLKKKVPTGSSPALTNEIYDTTNPTWPAKGNPEVDINLSASSPTAAEFQKLDSNVIKNYFDSLV